MDITDSKGNWRLTHNMITNLKTGKVRIITNMPSVNKVSLMHEKVFIQKCQNAFNSGIWE